MPDDPPPPEDLPPVRPALIADAPRGAAEAAPPGGAAEAAPPGGPAEAAPPGGAAEAAPPGGAAEAAPPGAEEAAPPPTEGAKPAPRSRTPYYLAGCAVLLLVGLVVVVGVVGLVGAGGATVAVLGAGALALAGSLGALFLFAGSAPDPAIAPKDAPDDAPVVAVTASSEAPRREADLRSGRSEPVTVAEAPPPSVEPTPAEDDAASEPDWLPEEEPAGTPSAPATSAPPAETKPRPGLKIATGVTSEVRLGKDQPVGVEGDAVVVLVSGGARYPLPGSAPPGRYDIEATFPGESPLVVGKITVGLGGNAVVVCNTNMGICRAK